MRVAVVIVNFNSGTFLGQCLDALQAQTVTPDRCIVVDNASDDDSFAAVENRPGWIWSLPLDVNSGFAAGNNIAISFVGDCEHVALLNPDAVPAPDWLENMLAGVDRHERNASYGCLMLGRREDDPLDGTGDVYHVSGLYWRRDHGRPSAGVKRAEAEIFSPCAAAALYHLKSFRDVGGFDEDYFCYSEDVDIGFRLRARGCRAWYLPDAMVRHAGSAITGRRSDFTTYYGHRNLVWTYIKNMPGRYFWIYFPQHVMMNIVSIIVFSLRGQGGAILKAKVDAIRGISRAIEKRRVENHLRLVRSEALVSVMRRGLMSPYLRRHE
jgi:GT2 family glycosyltransferase